MEKYKVPQHLHKPHQVLFLDADELAVMLVFFVLAIIFGYVFWILMIVVPYVYFKIKKRYARGVLRHLLYKAGLFNFKGAPHSFEKKFNE
ncbi:MAG: type IV conjugative transfer system protein TraL [Dictyoglomus turgidum]